MEGYSGRRGAEGEGARRRAVEPVHAAFARCGSGRRQLRVRGARAFEPAICILRRGGGPGPLGTGGVQYAFLSQGMVRVGWAPEAFNCCAPDTGNMEVLHLYGTREQKDQWLRPLM